MRGLRFSIFTVLIGLSLYPKANEGQSYSVWQRLPESKCGTKIAQPAECDSAKAVWVCQAIIDKLDQKVYTGYACISNTYEYYQPDYPTPAPGPAPGPGPGPAPGPAPGPGPGPTPGPGPAPAPAPDPNKPPAP